MTKKPNIIAVVNHLEIRKDSLYKVEPKFDPGAPDGYIKEGSTKLPSEGITTDTSCPYNSELGLYDTGFYEQSPCYAHMSKTEVQGIVRGLNTNIVKPYEALHGEGILSAQNNSFWDSYYVSLEEGLVLNTSKIDQLLALYIAMRGYALTPINERGNPAFLQSQYNIKDASKSISVKKERIMDKMEAVGAFRGMLTSEKDKLIDLLKYLDIVRTSIIPDEIDMNVAFDEWIEKDVQNPRVFLGKFEEIQSPEGLNKVRLKVRVSKAITKGIIKKTASGEYLHGSTPVGIDIKSIVNNLLSNKDLEKILDEIMMT